MAGSATRVAWKADDRLMAMIASQRSTGNDSTVGHVLDAGVVDEGCPRHRTRRRIGEHGLDLAGLAHVGAVVADAHAERRDRLARRLGVAEAVEHDVRALAPREREATQSDAARRSGDEGCLSLSMTIPSPGVRGGGRNGLLDPLSNLATEPQP